MTIGWMGQNPEFDEESSILKYVCEGKKIEDDYGYERCEGDAYCIRIREF